MTDKAKSMEEALQRLLDRLEEDPGAALLIVPGGTPDWKRWRLAQAVRRAAPRPRKPRR